MKKEKPDEPTEPKDEMNEAEDMLSLRDTVSDEMTELQKENKRLHRIVTDLHKKHHEHSLQVNKLSTCLKGIELDF